jgi:uncharacterized membrane protein YkvA (DUF1232 family)
MFRLLWLAKTAVFRAMPLIRDARVPVHVKAAFGLLALLIVSPIDVFSDIPVLGFFDDAALLALACVLFVRIAGKYTEPVRVTRRPGNALSVR